MDRVVIERSEEKRRDGNRLCQECTVKKINIHYKDVSTDESFQAIVPQAQFLPYQK